MRISVTILFLFFFLHISAADGEYAVSKIPSLLLKNANAVKRLETLRFEILNPAEATLKKKYVITILNEKGDHLAGFVEYYDKLREIKDIEGVLYDANGKEIKRLKNKQVTDLTAVDDNNLMDDNRRKIHNFYYKAYPYTIEYSVEIKFQGTLFFPSWMPRDEEYMSVEKSGFSIVYPSDYKVRVKAFNYERPIIPVAEKSKLLLLGSIENLPAFESEFAAPSWYEMNTAVLFAATEFEIEEVKGNMNSWKDFGDFVYSLKKGKDELPETVRKKVHQLADGIADPKEKAKVLYRYMQNNTRYISIQLGIGGWRPFDAKYVSSKAYGDCKALTNYMYSLLKEAGIRSLYTLVKAGRNASEIINDFPSQQFNHVILCVPFSKDSLWLECTSQTISPGYLGEFTCNRNVLLIDENGGTMVRTPVYGASENSQVRTIKAKLDGNATLSLTAISNYGALQQDRYHQVINGLSKDKLKEFLEEELDFGTYEISGFKYQEKFENYPFVNEELQIIVSNYATITGKRLFINPNIMTRANRRLIDNADRKYDIELGFAYTDIDSVEIELPDEYEIESMPDPVSINTVFGKYESSSSLNGRMLKYFRRIEHASGRFPAAAYTELVKFYDSIYRADRVKTVLLRK